SKLAGSPLRVENTNLFSGILAGLLTFGLLTKLIVTNLRNSSRPAQNPVHTVDTIGHYLVTDYSLPFEVVGVLLLVSLVGAAVITAFMKLKRS
ncbi:MAG TPA: NADH-quinone oxidoreductase subunit J, partial [Chryseosolibacter sp.]